MKEKILVIDDIVDFQETLLVVLRKAGYQAVGAQNGLDAVKMAEKDFFELIISDVRLPGLNGVETLMRIREGQQGRKSNMIIMSGYSDNESLIKAIQLGVDDFIKKPFGVEEFIHIVEKNITNYRLEYERGQYVQTINAFNDELLEKSERISAILYSLAEGVFTVDEKMVITHFNRSAEMLVGVPSEQALGRHCWEIIPNDLCKGGGCPVKKAMESRESVLGVETEVFTCDARTVPVMVSASLLKDSAGNIIGGVEVFRDISDSKRMMKDLEDSREEIRKWNTQLEERVQERTRDLQEANRKIQDAQAQMLQTAKMAAVGQLGAGVAHELNNPLGGILGYTQLIFQKLRNQSLNEKDVSDCKKYAEHIEVESLRCKAIIENLLLFSKKPFFTRPEPIDIGQVIRDAVSLIQYQFDAAAVGVVLEIEEGLPRVSGHVNRFQQVFMNLFINACKAMPDGGTLTVTAKRPPDGSKEQGCVCVQVQDSGCGIPEENLDQIFNAFFTTKEDKNSVGLGLFIVYQIIQEYNGRIEVESRPGDGATFKMCFKIEDGSPAA